ncbi:MAG: T9SS type A sorting domain-containing protein [Bacteroidetes bacterium]|nr:T9SS type A sorting domain-containing protein [Bacteroidota bacterium]
MMECYIIVGTVNNPFNIYLIKTDNNGDTLWTRIFDTGAFGASVKQTADGGYIITGSAMLSGNQEIYLAKTDSIGNPAWTKIIGGANDDVGSSVLQTTDGGYIIAGGTSNFGTGLSNTFLIKTNSTGDTLWTKTFGAGTNDELSCGSVIQTNDGGLLLCGAAYFDPSGEFGVLIKTDSIGNQSWARIYGSGKESLSQVRQTNDGGYISIGENSFGTQQAYLIKTDITGNSGCYDSSFNFTESAFPVQTANPSTVVSSAGSISSQNTITENGGTVTTLCLALGINDIVSNSAFEIFPNPTSDVFNLSFNKSIIRGILTIYNMIGQIFYSEEIVMETSKAIELKNVSSGVYLVKVFDGEKNYCKKIIIEHD